MSLYAGDEVLFSVIPIGLLVPPKPVTIGSHIETQMYVLRKTTGYLKPQKDIMCRSPSLRD